MAQHGSAPDPQITSDTVTSRDGTSIGYTRIGTGPALVICHGSFAAASDWAPVAGLLARTHTVYLYDRRGRGASPRQDAVADVDAEIDDLAAVVDIAGGEAALLGHSFGGGCVLAYAARERFSGTVIVYEPRHAIDGPVSRGRADAVEDTLAASGSEAALRLVLTEIIGLPMGDIDAFSASTLWPRMIDTVDSFADEVKLLDTLKWQPGDLDPIAGPVWLLVGEHTPVLESDREGALRSVLPDLHKLVVPGLGHFGYVTDPHALAEAVRESLGQTAVAAAV